MAVVVSFKTQEKVYIQCGDGGIAGYESVQKAIAVFENKYNRAHSRGYTWSMSACLNAVTFDVSVHEIGDTQELVDGGVIVLDDFRAFQVSSDSGSLTGGLCKGENALEWHESGKKPRLIS